MDRRAVLRVSIPVDDCWHAEEFRGPILHVATRYVDVVEVWFLNDPDTEPQIRELLVVGTGHEMPGRYVGTAIAPGGQLVWHLVERDAT